MSAITHKKLIDGLPVHVPEECLEQNPEFSKLLTELTQHVAPSGVSRQVQADLQQAEKELSYEKLPWLMHSVLYTELDQVIQDWELEKADSADTAHTDKAQFMSALGRAFTEMEISDYLNCSADPGSKVTLLGLTPDVVKEQNPQEQNLPYIEQKVIPLLEERMSKKCERYLDHYNSLQQNTEDTLTLAQVSQLPNAIEMCRQRVDEEKEQLQKGLQKHDAQFKVYYQTLLDSLHLLELLISRYRLRNQSQHDTVMAEWMAMKFDGLCLKIRVMELEIMVDTYTIESTKALQKIRDHLDIALSDTTKKRSQLQKLLETYQSVGMGFDDLVQEYGRLKDAVENKQWALSELQQTNTTADDNT